MAFTYRTGKIALDRVYRRDDSASTYSFASYGTNTWEIFPSGFTDVNDCIIFSQSNSKGAKFWKLELNIDTALVVDTLEGVWEVRGELTSKFGNTWIPATVISDTSNSFQNSGTQTIEIEPPEMWENTILIPGLDYYAWNLRFRITSIANLTNSGSVSYAYTYPESIVITGENSNMDDLYNADRAGGWGVVDKLGASTYTINSNITMDSASTFTSKNESITMLNNFMPFLYGEVNIGELSSTGKPRAGTSFRFEGSYSDYNATSLGRTNSKYYDCTIKFPRKNDDTSSQGFWGAGIGSYPNQVIRGGSFAGFRSYSFSDSSVIMKGFTYVNAFTEPCGAVMIDCAVNDAHYAIRPHPTKTESFVHRLDCTDVRVAATNPWDVVRINGWRMYLVDCNIDWSLPLAEYRIISSTYYDDVSTQALSSFQLSVLNSSNVPIDDVQVSVFDKTNTKVNALSTNEDGYVGVEKRVINSGSTTEVLNTTDYQASGKIYREILVTSGAAAGGRSVISGSTTSSLNLAEELAVAPSAGDRFIEIPYIAYRQQKPKADFTEGYAPLEDLGPFRVSYRKYGYVFSDDNLSFSSPLVSLRKLNINEFLTLSEANAGVLSGIAVNGANKTITITEEHSANEIYDYTQWWASRSENLVYDEPLQTTNGNNYSLASGWKLILNAKIIDHLNVNGDVQLLSDLDLNDITIDGDLYVDIGANSTLNFNNVIVTGLVYNDDPTHTLTINATGGSSLTADNAGTANGETNILQSATLTISGLVAGSEVRLYDSALNEIAGVESSSTHEDFTYNEAYVGAILVVHNVDYKPLRIELNLELSNSTLPVQQQFDRNYKNEV